MSKDRTRTCTSPAPSGYTLFKSSSVALVTGANRGIGLEVCRELAPRGFAVLLTARDAAKARGAAKQLGNVGTVEPLALDVADANSIKEAASTRTQAESLAFPVEGVDGGSVSMLAVRVG